jgi:hypothetical protein
MYCCTGVFYEVQALPHVIAITIYITLYHSLFTYRFCAIEGVTHASVRVSLHRGTAVIACSDK